ncbi:MAG: CotH kinase family protein [Bacteroidota bacterium]
MPLKFISTVVLLCLSICLQAQVNFTSSNLPIVLINTNGTGIPDEPKVSATLKIINNGAGQMNHIDDEPTDYDGPIGIEGRGQSSASFPKKPYGFETRDEMGENNNVSLLGMPEENDWVFHNPFSDKSLIRNAVSYTLAGKIMDYAPRVRMVEMVLNGDYRGVYLLTEKIKRDKNRVDIGTLTPESEDITGGYILKFDKGESSEVGFTSFYPPIFGQNQRTRFLWHYPKARDITPDQVEYISSFIHEFEEVLQSVDFKDPVNGYRKYIDVESFINFMFVNELTRNVDGYRISSFMYKDRDSEDGRLKMGPVWDFNLALGNADYCQGGNPNGWGHDFNSFCPNDFWVINFWWKRLLQDEAFLQEVKEKWLFYRQNELSDEVIFSTIDSLSNLLTANQAADRNFRRWRILGQYVWPNNFVGVTYQAEVDYLRNWTENRLQWLDQQYNRLTDVRSPQIANVIKVYPNPSSKGQTITFDYQLNARVNTTIRIYNSMGQALNSLVVDKNDEERFHLFTLDYSLPAGAYYYNVVCRDAVEFSGKFIVLD